jgi:hypothetical protein
MHEKQVYEYAVVRVVPRPERGECLNVGVVLYCRAARFLAFRYKIDPQRLAAAFPGLDLRELEAHLSAFQRICEGDPAGGPIAALDLPSRFRWLTARRSTVVQASEVHPGLCADARQALERLFAEQVGA